MGRKDNMDKQEWAITVVLLAAVALMALGCTPSKQAEGQVPITQGNDKTWRLVPMNNGPSFHVACYNGDRLFLMDSYFTREHEFHLTSPKTLTVAKGGCKDGS